MEKSILHCLQFVRNYSRVVFVQSVSTFCSMSVFFVRRVWWEEQRAAASKPTAIRIRFAGVCLCARLSNFNADVPELADSIFSLTIQEAGVVWRAAQNKQNPTLLQLNDRISIRVCARTQTPLYILRQLVGLHLFNIHGERTIKCHFSKKIQLMKAPFYSVLVPPLCEGKSLMGNYMCNMCLAPLRLCDLITSAGDTWI